MFELSFHAIPVKAKSRNQAVNFETHLIETVRGLPPRKPSYRLTRKNYLIFSWHHRPHRR